MVGTFTVVFFVKLYSVQRVNWTRKKYPEHSISLVHPKTIAQQNFLTLAQSQVQAVATSGGSRRQWHIQRHWLRRAARGALKSLVGRALSVLGDFRRDLLPLAPRGSHISTAVAASGMRRSGNTRQRGGGKLRGDNTRRVSRGMRRGVGMRR